MKKKLLSILICGILLATNNVTTKAIGQEEINKITPITAQELQENQEKTKLANQYMNSKIKMRLVNQMKELSSVRTLVQTTSYNCGPTAAYNATNAATSVAQFSYELGTSSSGTSFPGSWSYVMNTYDQLPGNAYTSARGNNYSSVSTWSSQLKNNIIYTIDKGYPVIADLEMRKEDPYYIYGAYSYMTTKVLHYVVVSGYDDLPATNPSEYKIIDSNDHRDIPLVYWTTLPKLAQSTYRLGIIW